MDARQKFIFLALIAAWLVSTTHSSAISDNSNLPVNDMLRDEDRFNRNKNGAKTHSDEDSSNLSIDNADDTSNANDNDDNSTEDEDNTEDDDAITISSINQLSLKDQIHWLTKQMSALEQRHRSDYRTLQNNLKKVKQKPTINDKMRIELDQLRHEIKMLNKGDKPVSNKERLTIDWFTKAVAEIRAELAELQEASSNTSRQLQQRNQCAEAIIELQKDFDQLKLEANAMRLRQDSMDQAIKELQSEAIQRDEDYRRSQLHTKKSAGTSDYVEPEADHRMRHQRFIRQQFHDLEMTQKSLKRQMNELQRHHISERLHSLESEQKRLANANFNVSRQMTSLSRLHGSMLELLEDIESIQNKFDTTIPDIRREISKVEFNAAQLSSEQNLLREEGHNAAKSIQALAVSVSTLQSERDNMKQLQRTINDLKRNVTKMHIAANTHRHMFHKRIEKIESDSKSNGSTEARVSSEIQVASKLVKQLESVEHQYESIINKLPADCSQIEQNTTGLFMIAPSGQQHPMLMQCIGHWTTIQRRQDGSVDFNRSWDEYSHGFGTPSGEYWIGNTVLNHLTSDHCTSLKIIMQDIYDNTWEAVYSDFYVAAREDGYRLSISGYSGNASDAFEYQNNMQFSAIDVDRDISNTHCAGNYEGGWWFSHCQHANLNGRYNLGLTWFDASRNEWIAVKSSHMMISKRTNCALPYTLPPSEFQHDSNSDSTTSSATSTVRPDVQNS